MKDDPLITLLKNARIPKSQLPELDDKIDPQKDPNHRNIAGVNVPVVEDKDIKDISHFIAMTKKKWDETVSKFGRNVFPEDSLPGYFCQLCGAECMLAPQGQILAAQGHKITCMDCMLTIVANNQHEEDN